MVAVAMLALSAAATRCSYSQSYFAESLKLPLALYQGELSQQRQPVASCQYTPSCSEYGKQAIAQYGAAAGIILATDRMMRCSFHANRGDYPVEQRKFSDPVSKNYLFGEGGLWRSGLSWRAPTVTDTVRAPFRFAHSLYRRGEYSYSNVELRRIEFENPELDVAAHATLLVAVNYLAAGEFKAGRAEMERLEEVQLPEDLLWRTKVVDLLLSDLAGLHDYNVNTFARSLKFARHERDAAALYGYAALRAEAWEKAIAAPGFAPADARAELERSILSSMEEIQQAGGRSGTLAAIASAILPGSGYMYLGKWGDGLSALSTNALFGWGIYTLFKNGNTGTGILLSGIALPFYLGNVVGPVNAAMAMNAKDREIAYAKAQQSLKLDFYFSTSFLDACWR